MFLELEVEEEEEGLTAMSPSIMTALALTMERRRKTTLRLLMMNIVDYGENNRFFLFSEKKNVLIYSRYMLYK